MATHLHITFLFKEFQWLFQVNHCNFSFPTRKEIECILIAYCTRYGSENIIEAKVVPELDKIIRLAKQKEKIQAEVQSLEDVDLTERFLAALNCRLLTL